MIALAAIASPWAIHRHASAACIRRGSTGRRKKYEAEKIAVAAQPVASSIQGPFT
jgi:hypothetical protein